VFPENAVNLEQYVSGILRPFVESITKNEKKHGYFMQYGAIEHTSNYLINV
jgi:hypothetical protein